MEYTTASITGLKPNEINDRINSYAQDGWELITVSFNMCFFKRQDISYKSIIVGKDDTVIDGKIGNIIHTPSMSKPQVTNTKNLNKSHNKTIKGKKR